MPLDKAALKACNIVYELEPRGPLPAHIERVKDHLLDFGFGDFQDVVDLDSDVEYKSLEEKCRNDKQKELLGKADETTQAATNHEKQGCNEADWQRFYSEYFRAILNSCINENHTDNRQTARSKFYYGNLESEFQSRWVLFAQQGHEHQKREGLTMPNPDWMIAFPSYDESYIESLPRLRNGRRPKRLNDTLLSSFSNEVILHLAKHGIQSRVSNSLSSQESGTEVELRQYKCFPFLVMEHKGSGQCTSKIEHCYAQTANGTSAALLLFQKLFKYNIPGGCNYERVPPVIGISTVASEVRVWVTYTDPKQIKMDCIWTGDLKKIAHALRLQYIFENIYTWATLELRPKLKWCIEEWLSEFPLPSTINESFQQPVTDESSQPSTISDSLQATATDDSSQLPNTDETSQPATKDDSLHPPSIADASQLPITDETSQPSMANDPLQFSPADAPSQLPTVDDTLQSTEGQQQENFLHFGSLSNALKDIFQNYKRAPFLSKKNAFFSTKQKLSLSVEDESDDDSAWSEHEGKHSRDNSGSDDDEEYDVDNNIVSLHELYELKTLESFKILVETSRAIIDQGEGYELYAKWDDNEPLLAAPGIAHLEQTDNELSEDELRNGSLLFDAVPSPSRLSDTDELGAGSDEWEDIDEDDSDGNDEIHSSAGVSSEDDDDDEEISHCQSNEWTPPSSPPPEVTPPRINNGRTRFLSLAQQRAHEAKQRARSSTPTSRLQPQPDSSRSTSVPPAVEREEDARVSPQASNQPSSLQDRTLKVEEIHRAIRMTFSGEKSKETMEASPQASNQQSSRHEELLKCEERLKTLGIVFSDEESDECLSDEEPDEFTSDEEPDEIIDLSPQARKRQSGLHEIAGVEENLPPGTLCPSLSGPSSSKVVEEPQDRPKTPRIFFPSHSGRSSSKSVEAFQDNLKTPRILFPSVTGTSSSEEHPEKLKTSKIFFPSPSGTTSSKAVEEPQDRPKTPKLFFPSLSDPLNSDSAEGFHDKLTTPRIFFPSRSGTSSPNLVEEPQDKPKTPKIFFQFFGGAMSSPESEVPQDGAPLPSIETKPTLPFNFEFKPTGF